MSGRKRRQLQVESWLYTLSLSLYTPPSSSAVRKVSCVTSRVLHSSLLRHYSPRGGKGDSWGSNSIKIFPATSVPPPFSSISGIKLGWVGLPVILKTPLFTTELPVPSPDLLTSPTMPIQLVVVSVLQELCISSIQWLNLSTPGHRWLDIWYFPLPSFVYEFSLLTDRCSSMAELNTDAWA